MKGDTFISMEARENTTGISQIDQEAANAVLRAGLLAEVDQEAGNSFLAGSMLTTYSRFGGLPPTARASRSLRLRRALMPKK